jgi:hypothetical protein
VEGVIAPAPGWYPDPAGSSSYRWWDGGGWTTNLAAPQPVATPSPVPAPQPQVQQTPAPSPVVASVATEYVGDPRFGGPAAVPAVNLHGVAPTPSAPPGSSAGRLQPSTRRPTSHLVVAGVAAAAVLLGSVLAGKALLGGSGGTDGSSGPSGGLLDQGNPRVVAMRADVLGIADAEENVFAGTQSYAAVRTTKGPVVVAGHSIRLSSPQETVQVAVSPSGTGFCVRAARTPAGGGTEQVLVYISTQGGFQPPTITTCPAAF